MDQELIAVMVAVVGGLAGFGLLVVLGSHLVRRLGILGEPPDDLAYEPPPPAPCDPDATAAPRRAHQQRELAGLHRLAWEIRSRADEAASLVPLAPDAVTVTDWRHRAAGLMEQAERAKVLLNDLPGKAVTLRRLHSESRQAHEALRTTAEPYVNAVLTHQRRRLLLLVVLLVLSVAGAGLLLLVRPQP